MSLYGVCGEGIVSIYAKLISGNLTPKQTAALKQC